MGRVADDFSHGLNADFPTQRRKAAQSQSDGWKLASYEPAGGGEQNKFVPDGTMENGRRFSGASPATM
jgi:hypothetical protein